MKRWKISVAMDGLATGLPLSTSHKFRVATLSFLFGAICLCLVPGLWAQSAKAPAPASGSNNQPALIAGNTGCGYSTGRRRLRSSARNIDPAKTEANPDNHCLY